MFKLSILLSLSFSTISLADTPAAPEDPLPTMWSSGDDQAQEVVAEPRFEIEVTLTNGIILNGTANQTDVITWLPTSALTLYLPEGNDITLEGALISSVDVVTATPSPIFVEQPVLEAATEPPAESNPDSTPTETNPDSTPTAPEQAEPPPAPPYTSYTSPAGFSHPNPAGGRYAYAPTAIPMQQGQAYVSQKYGIVSSAAYAVTDNLAILFGTFTFYPPALTVFGAKYAFEVSEDVHIGFGGETFIFPMESQLLGTIGFTNITIGDLDNNITLAVGALSSDYLPYLAMPLMLGLQTRVSNKVSLVSENWLLIDLETDRPPFFMNALTMRFLGERLDDSSYGDRWRTERGFPKRTWDLGFVVLGGGGEFIGPLPWVDWSWHFGALGN